ncbi:MAG: cytidine deaminase [Anaerolineales bacterium]|nr:cytidine deaminase [Anaerolineales bacterium]
MINETLAALVAKAAEGRSRAYIPYSHYAVGAALLDEDGTIYTGCNVENASYGGTICAERTALVKAVSEGARRFTTICVMTENGGSPCGICRQVLYEFNPDMSVILASPSGAIVKIYTLRDLLPDGFGAEKLP